MLIFRGGTVIHLNAFSSVELFILFYLFYFIIYLKAFSSVESFILFYNLFELFSKRFFLIKLF